jgi:mono/diheme cytochrome c family protein
MQSPFAEGAPGGETAVASDFGPIDPKLAKAGRAIFERENCLECHRLGDEGSGRKAPNLRGIGSKHSDPKWFMEMLHDPASKDRARMPAFDNLNRSELRQIAEFLRSQTR